MDGTGSPQDACPAGCGAGVPIGYADGEAVYKCATCRLMFYSDDVRHRPASDDDWWADDDPGLNDTLRQGRADMAHAFTAQLSVLEGLTDKRSLLDVGAGAGIFLACARDRGWSVCGQDKNPHAAIAANNAFGELTYVADLSEIAPGSVDVLRISHVLEHVADPVPFLTLLHEKLAPGGVLTLIVPNGAPLVYSAVNALRRCRTKRPNLAAPMSPGFHLLGLSSESLHRMTERVGFSPINVRSISMGNATYYPMFYDGLVRRIDPRTIPVRTLLRYWMPFIVDNLGNPFGKGQWLVGHFRKP